MEFMCSQRHRDVVKIKPRSRSLLPASKSHAINRIRKSNRRATSGKCH